MEDVGLYRVSGAKSDIDEIKRYFEENHPDLSEKLARVDTHAVTGCMKRFFMNLREPLIPHPYADKLFKTWWLFEYSTKIFEFSQKKRKKVKSWRKKKFKFGIIEKAYVHQKSVRPGEFIR